MKARGYICYMSTWALKETSDSFPCKTLRGVIKSLDPRSSESGSWSFQVAQDRDERLRARQVAWAQGVSSLLRGLGLADEG